jgi:hypothetical protein
MGRAVAARPQFANLDPVPPLTSFNDHSRYGARHV